MFPTSPHSKGNSAMFSFAGQIFNHRVVESTFFFVNLHVNCMGFDKANNTSQVGMLHLR